MTTSSSAAGQCSHGVNQTDGAGNVRAWKCQGSRLAIEASGSFQSSVGFSQAPWDDNHVCQLLSLPSSHKMMLDCNQICQATLVYVD